MLPKMLMVVSGGNTARMADPALGNTTLAGTISTQTRPRERQAVGGHY